MQSVSKHRTGAEHSGPRPSETVGKLPGEKSRARRLKPAGPARSAKLNGAVGFSPQAESGRSVFVSLSLVAFDLLRHPRQGAARKFLLIDLTYG